MSTLVLIGCLVVSSPQDAFPTGRATTSVQAGGHRIEVFTYRPEAYKDGPLILVFHGTLRNADEYRDHARAMGDRFGALIAAPHFDKEQFGPGMYQQGGLYRDGKLLAEREWTLSRVREIADGMRRKAGRPDMPYYLVGHSAGGQFVGRTAALVETGASRVVVANPSSYVFPTREWAYPYGFGGLPDEFSDDRQIRRYLARPVTIYLGAADTERDEDLDKSAEADRQGRTRLERGRRAFDEARRLAEERGWEFGWSLVEAPDVPHDHEKMFDSPSFRAALLNGSRAADRP